MNTIKMELDLKFSRVLLGKGIKTSKLANNKTAENISLIFSRKCSLVRRKLEVARTQKMGLPSKLSKDFSAWPVIKSSIIGKKNNS